MGNLIVAVLGALGYSSNLGKKGTSTDITLYDLKRGEDIVTLVEATKYPERLPPLFFATSMAERAIVVVDDITARLWRVCDDDSIFRHQEWLHSSEKLLDKGKD